MTGKDPRRDGDLDHLRKIASVHSSAWVNAAVYEIRPGVAKRLAERGWIDRRTIQLGRHVRLTDAGRTALSEGT